MTTAKKPVLKKPTVKEAAPAKEAVTLKPFPRLEKDIKKLAARAASQLKESSAQPYVSPLSSGFWAAGDLQRYIRHYLRWLEYREKSGKTAEKIAVESAGILDEMSEKLEFIEFEDTYKALEKAGKPSRSAYKAFEDARDEVRARKRGLTLAVYKKTVAAEYKAYIKAEETARQARIAAAKASA